MDSILYSILYFILYFVFYNGNLKNISNKTNKMIKTYCKGFEV